jgi:hypothetical protein
MVGTYKNITIKSFPQFMNNGHWKTHIAIVQERDGISNSRSFSSVTSQPTEDEAHYMDLGQRLIDGRLPDHWLD